MYQYAENIPFLQASYDSYVQRLQGLCTRGYTTKKIPPISTCPSHLPILCIYDPPIPMQVAVKIMNKQSLGVCFSHALLGSMS